MTPATSPADLLARLKNRAAPAGTPVPDHAVNPPEQAFSPPLEQAPALVSPAQANASTAPAGPQNTPMQTADTTTVSTTENTEVRPMPQEREDRPTVPAPAPTKRAYKRKTPPAGTKRDKPIGTLYVNA